MIGRFVPPPTTPVPAAAVPLVFASSIGDWVATLLMAATLVLPLALLGLLALPRRVRSWAPALAPWAAAPAVALALVAPSGATLELPWLLLGSRFGLDDTGRVFLLLTGIPWLLAGIYARGYLRPETGANRYFRFHLLTLAGNLGVVLAHDIIGFYLSFVLMTLAAFGLIIFDLTAAARRAALVYLVMAILAEGLLLFALIASTGGEVNGPLPALAGTGTGGLAGWLLLLGFGVKAGLPLLHMWLPLAHPEAPTPASAVLSAAMIKAGLLGWLRFLPLGGETEASMGQILMMAGLLAAFLGALVGVTQRRPKTLLAYSSVSQMGFVSVAVGAALTLPDAWPLARLAILVFAFHHALTKGALFLGVGLIERLQRRPSPARTGALTGVGLAAAMLAGLPFTGGALAKSLIKEALGPLPQALAWASAVPELITLASAGTALLMLRLLALLQRADDGQGTVGAGMRLAWPLSLVAAALGPPLLAWSGGLTLHGFIDLGFVGAGARKAWELVWPTLLAVALFLPLARSEFPRVPPGDLLLPLERLAAGGSRVLRRIMERGRGRPDRRRQGPGGRQLTHPGHWAWLERLEGNLMRWDSAGALLLTLGLLLAAALWGLAGAAGG